MDENSTREELIQAILSFIEYANHPKMNLVKASAVLNHLAELHWNTYSHLEKSNQRRTSRTKVTL